MATERLQKILAAAGVASRRHAEELITGGHITVNGATVTELGARADPESDDIRVDGRPALRPAKPTYVILNKPAGYVTTAADERGRRTVFDLLPTTLPRLHSVGRLDRETEGLLLLTDDGDLTYRLTHPSHEVPKEYIVLVQGSPTPEALHQLRHGVELDDRATATAFVELMDQRRPWESDSTWLRIVLWEGRNRQIRRMCLEVGHPVLRLRRASIGPIRLGEMKPGEWRRLTKAEVSALRRATETGGSRERVPIPPPPPASRPRGASRA